LGYSTASRVRAFRRHLAEHAHLDGAGIEVPHAVLRSSELGAKLRRNAKSRAKKTEALSVPLEL
jgi:hypothetical protein